MKHVALIAWGPFASTWMLAWGAAAAIPLLIHLWNRRQQREVRWAAMQFLLAAVRRRARRLRFEQWILLATRVLILLMLALALADPYMATLPSWPLAAETGRTHTVLVMDGSFSMASRVGDRSCFELARERALDLVRAGAQGDGFTVLMMTDPPRGIVRDAVFDRGDLADEIESLRVGHSVSGLLPTLSEVERTLNRVIRRHPRLTLHRVCFITDLGRATWGEIELEAARAQLAELSTKAQLSVIPIQRRAPANLAITDVSSTTAWPAAGEDISFTTQVRNFGSRSQRSRLELLVDGRGIAEQQLEVPPGADVVHAFGHRFLSAGQHLVEARLDADDLSVDNRRWLSLAVPEAMRVLCIEGRRGAAKFATLALAPEADGRSVVQPVVAGENSLFELDLRDFDCVMLCNVEQFQSEESEFLAQYVRDGGGLVIILGDQARIENYNQLLGGGGSAPGLLPARLEGPDGSGTLHFDPLEYQHPIAAPFRGHERAGLLTAPIWRYVRLTPAAEARLALRFDDGRPALVTGQFGRGRTVLLATAVSPDSIDPTADPPRPWSALHVWPSFPPLIREMINFAAAGRFARQNVHVGELISGTLPRGSANTRLTLEDPSGLSQQLPVNFDASPPRWTFAETRLSGVYHVASDRPGQPRQSFAVNVDVVESDLESLDPATLPSQLAPLADRAVDGTASASRPRRPPLFRLLLGTLLLMCLIESTLASRFGGRYHETHQTTQGEHRGRSMF